MRIQERKRENAINGKIKIILAKRDSSIALPFVECGRNGHSDDH